MCIKDIGDTCPVLKGKKSLPFVLENQLWVENNNAESWRKKIQKLEPKLEQLKAKYEWGGIDWSQTNYTNKMHAELKDYTTMKAMYRNSWQKLKDVETKLEKIK